MEVQLYQTEPPISEVKIYEHAIHEWGRKAQLLQLAQELAELQEVVIEAAQACAGPRNEARNDAPIRNHASRLREEAVDVGIMLGQLREMGPVDVGYEDEKERKLRLLAERLNL